MAVIPLAPTYTAYKLYSNLFLRKRGVKFHHSTPLGSQVPPAYSAVKQNKKYQIKEKNL